MTIQFFQDGFLKKLTLIEKLVPAYQVGLLIVHCSAILCFKHIGMQYYSRVCYYKINTKFNVVCTQIVLHCGTNRECGIN